MIESMACGCPVIAFPRGSVPEVMEDGVTGFVVRNDEEAVAAVRRLGELDRTVVRRRFDERWTARRMAEDYVDVYEELIAARQPKLRAVRRLTGFSRPGPRIEGCAGFLCPEHLSRSLYTCNGPRRPSRQEGERPGMKKLLLATVAAIGLAAAFPAAPAQAEDWLAKAAVPFKGAQINVIFLDRPGYRAIEKLLPDFEKRTGIKVSFEVVPYENTREKEVLNFNSQGELTVALVDLVWIGEYAENGWILPIDKFASDPSITDPNLNLKGFFPLLLEAFGSWGGKTYGLPFDNYSGLLFYNKCHLKDAGFDKPPATWPSCATPTRRS